MDWKNSKWDLNDFGQAMVNAVYRHAPHKHIKHTGSKLTFNGFWRDGSKRNVCIWPKKASWSDLHISDNGSLNRGGVKSFAKTVLNMDLHEFMKNYGSTSFTQIKSEAPIVFPTDYIHNIWSELLKRNSKRFNHGLDWLLTIRKFRDPNQLSQSGFTNLSSDDIPLFASDHQKLIQTRLSLGRNIVVPIRSIKSEKVQSLFIRTVDNVAKNNQSRFITGCGGWLDNDGAPRAFGFPHLIHEFPNLIILEGMADYFAAESLLGTDENYLPIGAPGTAAIIKWGSWLSQIKYRGKVHVVYQLDTDHNGGFTKYGPGQRAAVEIMKTLNSTDLSVCLFNWPLFLKRVALWQQAPRDLAEVFTCSDASQETLSKNFLTTLRNGQKND